MLLWDYGKTFISLNENVENHLCNIYRGAKQEASSNFSADCYQTFTKFSSLGLLIHVQYNKPSFIKEHLTQYQY